MSDNATEKKGIPAGFLAITTLIGSVAGAIIGLMVAPQSGKKTRERLIESYDGVSSKINDVVKKVDEKVPSIMARVKNDFKDVPEQVKGEILSFTKDAEERIGKAVERSSAYLHEVKDSLTATFEGGKGSASSTVEIARKKGKGRKI
jgi:gas vesicle protein